MLDHGQKAQVIQSISDQRIQQILYGYYQDRLAEHIEDIRQSATLVVLEMSCETVDDCRRAYVLACIRQGGAELTHLRQTAELTSKSTRRAYEKIDCKMFPDVFLNYLTALQRKIVRFRRNGMSYKEIAYNAHLKHDYAGSMISHTKKKYLKWLDAQHTDWKEILSSQEARLYEMRYLQGLTNGVIAEKLKVSTNRVAQWFFVLHSRLRKSSLQVSQQN